MQTPDIVWCKLLKELVILTSQRVPEVGIQAVEGILPKVLYLIPWIENRKMLVCTRKSQLYPNAAIYRTPSIFTAWCFNGTVLFVETNESGVSWAFSTSISFPVQILQSTLLKLEYLQQSPFDIRYITQEKVINYKGYKQYIFTKVKLVTMYVLFATKAGGDLAAYLRPANATMYPPYESYKAQSYKSLSDLIHAKW